MARLTALKIFCNHEWEEVRFITLDTAMKNVPALTQIKVKKSDIFYDRTIIVYQCPKCKKLKAWKF